MRPHVMQAVLITAVLCCSIGSADEVRDTQGVAGSEQFGTPVSNQVDSKSDLRLLVFPESYGEIMMPLSGGDPEETVERRRITKAVITFEEFRNNAPRTNWPAPYWRVHSERRQYVLETREEFRRLEAALTTAWRPMFSPAVHRAGASGFPDVTLVSIGVETTQEAFSINAIMSVSAFGFHLESDAPRHATLFYSPGLAAFLDDQLFLDAQLHMSPVMDRILAGQEALESAKALISYDSYTVPLRRMTIVEESSQSTHFGGGEPEDYGQPADDRQELEKQ